MFPFSYFDNNELLIISSLRLNSNSNQTSIQCALTDYRAATEISNVHKKWPSMSFNSLSTDNFMTLKMCYLEICSESVPDE